MDLKQIEYILKIAEENNVTKAAEKLFISQSALNQQLLKLEKELGAPLFFRTRNNWTLTEIGELYVQNAKEIMAIKKNTYNQIADMLDNKKRQFTLGLIPGRTVEMFATVYSRFLKRYPNISMSTVEIGSLRQQAMIADGKLSMGFLTLCASQRNSRLHYYPICSEEFFIAVPPGHPLSREMPSGVNMPPEIDIQRFKDDSFVMMHRESSSRAVSDQIFQEAGIEPQILFETASTGSILKFVSAGLACALLPKYYILKLTPAERRDLTFYSLPSHPKWDMLFASNELFYLSRPLKEFIRMSKEYWDDFYASNGF